MHIIADMLTRIRNAQLRKAQYVLIPKTKLARQVALVLSNEGFLDGVEELSEQVRITSKRFLRLCLPNQRQNTKSKAHIMKVISKPGCRVYVTAKNIPTLRQDLSLCIMSTSKGIMTSKEAQTLKIGGEVLCTIW